MDKIYVLLIFVIFFSCQQQNKQERETTNTEKTAFTTIIEKEYELYKPDKTINAVLILFGGYPETAEDIKSAFKILDLAKDNDIAVILSNYNRKLWLEENEKLQLAETFQNIIKDNELPADRIFMGGFSSGGVVSLLLSNFICGTNKFYINPKGVFIIDSPIDLTALYLSSQKNIEQGFSEISVQESTGLVAMLNKNFGNPLENIEPYEDKSVFTFRTGNFSNLDDLEDTKIRLYTEPDTLWWKKNRMNNYDQTNAFYIKKLSETLKEKGYKNVEYIATKNKGYRANGERHPHSWSIVDKKDLINWMLEK